MKKLSLLLLFFSFSAFIFAQDWPTVNQEAKPGTRWWWLGSAVDSANISYNLETYAKAGIGAVEITPIYGVKGNESHEISFLSNRWMNMLDYVISEGKRVGIQVDMNTGTGWPFGGPEIDLKEAAAKAIFKTWKPGEQMPELTEKEKKSGAELYGTWKYDTINVALYVGHTLQKVKRAAPGGEGWVMDHLNRPVVEKYLSKFTRAFNGQHQIPNTFFNDSYEVFNADWSPILLDEFEKRRGYKLQDYFPDFLDEKSAIHKDLICDYRETMSELLLEDFTNVWADWAHSLGAKVRNQAHGSPANLLDVYAAVDIPEIEGYGLSNLGIVGLRKDSITKKNDSDWSMFKWASSAAHVTGKPFTSAETFTWLTEHFRTSLSQCKPDFDLMMIGGVNHCYFHGTTYSPREAPWPGYLFYASMEMSPINTIWNDAPVFFKYMTRVQSFMQWGIPDNDLLVYLPIYDIWSENPGRLLQLTIHAMNKRAPNFSNAVSTIYDLGYDVDYISDNMLKNTSVIDGKIQTEGGAVYKALVIPEVVYMQENTMQQIIDLAEEGACIVVVGSYPTNIPGYSLTANGQDSRLSLCDRLPKLNRGSVQMSSYGKGRIILASSYEEAMPLIPELKAETMKSEYGVKCIRRKNDTGYHYFISSLQDKGIDNWVSLAVDAEAAELFDPITGKHEFVPVKNEDDVSKVRLQLASGESVILQTYDKTPALETEVSGSKVPGNNNGQASSKNKKQASNNKEQGSDKVTWYLTETGKNIDLTNSTWTFDASGLDVDTTIIKMSSLEPWTNIKSLATTKGNGIYKTVVKISKSELKHADEWVLDLGDVRESAHVFVNGKDAGTAFSVPFKSRIGQYLKPGKNQITIEVTGLAANYIAQMDRDKKEWRIFKDANIAPLPETVKVSDFSKWGIIPCGLNSNVTLKACKYE